MQYMNWRQCIICLWIFVIAFVLMMGSILTITTTIKLKQQHTNRNNNNKNNRSTLTHLPTLSEFMLKSNYLHNNTKKTTKSSPGLITTTAAKRTTIQTKSLPTSPAFELWATSCSRATTSITTQKQQQQLKQNHHQDNNNNCSKKDNNSNSPLQRLNSERLPAQEQPPSPQDLPLAREPQSTPDRVEDDQDKEYDSDEDHEDDDDDQDDHLCGGVKLRLPLSLARLDTRLKPRFRFRKSSYKIRWQGAQDLWKHMFLIFWFYLISHLKTCEHTLCRCEYCFVMFYLYGWILRIIWKTRRCASCKNINDSLTYWQLQIKRC